MVCVTAALVNNTITAVVYTAALDLFFGSHRSQKAQIC